MALRYVLIEGVDRRLKQIIAGVAEETDSLLLESEVMLDHVHILIDVDPQFGVDKKKCRKRARHCHPVLAETAKLGQRGTHG